jgi:hypothetical protein
LISLRPQSAKLMSATWKSVVWAGFKDAFMRGSDKGSGPLTKKNKHLGNRGAHLTLSVGERSWKKVPSLTSSVLKLLQRSSVQIF